MTAVHLSIYISPINHHYLLLALLHGLFQMPQPHSDGLPFVSAAWICSSVARRGYTCLTHDFPCRFTNPCLNSATFAVDEITWSVLVFVQGWKTFSARVGSDNLFVNLPQHQSKSLVKHLKRKINPSWERWVCYRKDFPKLVYHGNKIE